MKVSELKGILNEMVEPLKLKKVLTVSKEAPKNTKEMMITYPNPGYHGIGILSGDEEFYWSLYYDGKDWRYDSELLTE